MRTITCVHCEKEVPKKGCNFCWFTFGVEGEDVEVALGCICPQCVEDNRPIWYHSRDSARGMPSQLRARAQKALAFFSMPIDKRWA